MQQTGPDLGAVTTDDCQIVESGSQQLVQLCDRAPTDKGQAAMKGFSQPLQQHGQCWIDYDGVGSIKDLNERSVKIQQHAVAQCERGRRRDKCG